MTTHLTLVPQPQPQELTVLTERDTDFYVQAVTRRFPDAEGPVIGALATALELLDEAIGYAEDYGTDEAAELFDEVESFLQGVLS
jgi:hypothetical protein